MSVLKLTVVLYAACRHLSVYAVDPAAEGDVLLIDLPQNPCCRCSLHRGLGYHKHETCLSHQNPK